MSDSPLILPAATALVVMDFQDSILASIREHDALLQRVAALIDKCRQAGMVIAFVRVAPTVEDLAAFPAHSAMGQRMRAAGEKVLADSPSTQPHAALRRADGDILVRKVRVGPFSTTDLHARLRARGVQTLVLAGIHTSGCVLSAVREAHDLDYRMLVLREACADPAADVHEFLMDRIFPKQATVLSMDEFLGHLDPGNAA